MTNKTERTSRGLMETLFQELDDLKSGSSTPQNARAKAALVNTICSITRLEIEHAKYVSSVRGKSPTSEIPRLVLGS
jgi:hypothetical protein